MKSIDLLCASPASTAICSSTVDQKAIIRHGIRSIDRHIHRLGEAPARRRTNSPPCSSHLPFDPKARKSSETFRRKSCADADDRPASSRYLLSDKSFVDNSVSDYSSTKPLIYKDNRRNYTRMNPDGFAGLRSMSSRSAAYESPVYDPNSSLAKIQKDKLGDHLNARKSSSPPSNHQVN